MRLALIAEARYKTHAFIACISSVVWKMHSGIIKNVGGTTHILPTCALIYQQEQTTRAEYCQHWLLLPKHPDPELLPVDGNS